MLGWCRRHDTEKGHLLTDVAVPAVEIDGVTKRYGRTLALDNVSFQVRPGELFALLGPNGAGKTTTFNMVVGVLKPDGGTVRFQQRDITRLPMHKRARLGMGYLTQEPSVFRKLTVEQNILAILETCRISRTERRIRLGYLLDELDLASLAKSKAYMLSGGEKRRQACRQAYREKMPRHFHSRSFFSPKLAVRSGDDSMD